MTKRVSRRVCRLLALVCLGGGIVLAGCSKKDGPGKLVPVSGKVTLNGKPLTAGTVSFVADSKKGNTSKHFPGGQLSADGTYELKTDGATGAPLGVFKVTIMNMDFKQMVEGKKKPDVTIPPAYTTPDSTPVSKEVVESPAPGAYDINLK